MSDFNFGKYPCSLPLNVLDKSSVNIMLAFYLVNIYLN